MKKRTAKTARELGASTVKPLDVNGLEVVFYGPLVKTTPYGNLAFGSTVFPLSCLNGFDTDDGWLILADDYQVWQNLDSGTLMFKSDTPNKLPRFVRKDKVVSIRILPSGRFLYPTFPTS